MKVKYKAIYEDIKHKIQTGEYPVGSQLPDEYSFCDQYGCSRMTVKKALDMLVEEGYVYRKQGQGTFVLSQKVRNGSIEISERDLSGFTLLSWTWIDQDHSFQADLCNQGDR